MTIFQIKWIRWKYVLPRLALVLIIAATFRFGLDPALKWAIVAGGESAVGAKVDLANVETSLRDGQIVLSNLAVTNPLSPMRNLLQAERAQLYLDVDALLHKRFVIRDGTLSGLQFDTDRLTSGELAKTQATEDEGSSLLSTWVDSTDQLAAEWFDQLTERLDTDLADQLQTPRVAKELEQRWPKQYEEMRGRVKRLQQNIKELETGLKEVRKNPLRHLERIGQLQQQLVASQRDLQTLRQQIEQLPRQVEADQRAILVARQHDEQFLREKLQISDLNGEGLSQTLLGETVNERLMSALQWVSWARRQLPARSAKKLAAKTRAARARGTNVLFGNARPRYLVERLQLEGFASMGGEQLPIVGTLTGATTEPHLWADPMRISLQGSGATLLALEATLDRRNAVAVDHLSIDCPQLAMPGRTLGNPNKLAVKVAPGIAIVRIDLTLTDDQLAGKIIFSQPSVELTVGADSSKNRHLAAALEQALAGIGNLEANVTLAGTITKPQITLQSDLGPQLAAGINTAVQQLVKQRGQELLAKTQAKVDEQLQRLDQSRQQAQQELLAKLGKHQELLGQLAALSGGTTPGLSIPKIGQAFRLGTQRK